MAYMSSQLRVLTLNEGENRDTTLFRLEKGWTLHFVLGPSLAGHDVRIFVNHPAEGHQGPDRHTYRQVPWSNYSGSKWDIYDNYCEVHMVMGGSFNYFFTIDGSDKHENANGRGNFLVDPTLRVGKFDEKLPLDSITCQTVLTKSLGPFEQWPARLRVAYEAGYNMVHFTPLQQLGASNSSYCLSDQLKLNSVFSPGVKKYTFDDVATVVHQMKQEWEMLSITDLVFNHTANESPWIQTHPECAYNLINSPHLKPAYLLDRVLWYFTLEVAEGVWEDRGVPPNVSTEDHLNAIRSIVWDTILPKYRIHEYYMVHIDDVVNQFRAAMINRQPKADRPGKELEIIPDPKFRRLKATVDIPLALHLFDKPKSEAADEHHRVEWCCGDLRTRLEQLNHAAFSDVQAHLGAAVNNLVANARWRFVNPAGDQVKQVTAKTPIMYNYFTLPKEKNLSIEREQELMDTKWGAFCMAHNGWVMNDDPLRNFAEPGSNVYLRRELIPWGDSVKLRYGKGPEDCPFLWQFMREYTVITARIFHGVRLDNCHSTPIHVAEYMLDEARKVRPDLYVLAELFTSSESKDNVFINRLGINSLIREALSAWDSHEEGRLVHRYGGQPVGAFIQPPARPLVPTVAHAIFFDQTHDNPSPVQKRSVYDLLPSASLVAMACCASGSNRGYDELVNHHIHVVKEPRLYTSWGEKVGQGSVNLRTGIIAAKKVLNKLHYDMGMAGFNQVFVDQVTEHVVSVTRHNPVSHQSVILIAHTAFSQPKKEHQIRPLTIPGVIDEVLLEARLEKLPGDEKYVKDDSFINGLPGYQLVLREQFPITESKVVKLKTGGHSEQLVQFVNFPAGSVIAFRVSLNPDIKSAIMSLRGCLSSFGYRVHTYSGRNLKDISSTEIEEVVAGLALNDLNRVLYRCDAEERSDGLGFGAYNVPGYGDLTYCGLQGIMSVLSRIRAKNDLGHPLCNNLRQGDWLVDYTANRLKPFTGTARLGAWFEKTFSHLKHVPRYLVPCYFDAIVTGVHMLVEEVAWAKMAEFVRSGSTFVRMLAMGSLQFCSVVKTASLPQLSPNLEPPCPPMVTNGKTGKEEQACVSLSAGLPHFSSGIMRNWGRDTFISLRGLLLLCGRSAEARFIILAYAGTLRHGLIPNLLGSGLAARYNCRDAVWWWLQCIQQYVRQVVNGGAILRDAVSRLYPRDDDQPQSPGSNDQPLYDVIQEALQRHADGVKYRERNAGRAVDNDMSDPGFNVEVGVHWDTGFVYGGNIHNCGTWMDKMGSSESTGNKGIPATPRDGSAVELVGLCRSTLCWLSEMHATGQYPYDGVTRSVNGKTVKVTFAEWARLIDQNFERHFWVDPSSSESYVNRRGIYKDSFGASQPWADYQLRPNFPVAIVVAPQMVTPERAWLALSLAEELLLGPLGMKTLDPSDWAYNGNYINSDESRGFNYHQGPEWVWPVGYFLRAKLCIAARLEASRPGLLQQTTEAVKCVLSQHNVCLQASDWRSLPELTNKDGAVCHDSCDAQAWSMACILEVLYDLERLAHKSG